MEITQYYLTNNRCYKAGKRMTPKGIVVHSTGANNPNLCRYIGPDDGVIGPNKYDNHWNQPSSSKCVHAMIGKDKIGVVRCYQTLPWDYKPWGCGSGSKGSYNNSHIQFEMQEDDLADTSYFAQVYDLAVSLCAYLCKEYDIHPGEIVSHREAHDAGYASNHGDPHAWFNRHGKDMDTFRADVAGKLTGNGASLTEDAESLGQKMVNTPGDTLNVRGAANVNGKKLGELKDRSLVEIYGLAGNGWVLIQQGSLRGWVNGKYLVEPKKAFAPYIVRVTADALNIRKGPGANYDVDGCIRDKGSYTIIGEQDGWGRLKSGAGWISLAYTTKAGDAGAKPELTRVLKLVSPNMRGEDVRWAQARLNALGYNCGTPDGIFGPNTDKAVKAFQRANGLSQDGDIGPKTWAKL